EVFRQPKISVAEISDEPPPGFRQGGVAVYFAATGVFRVVEKTNPGVRGLELSDYPPGSFRNPVTDEEQFKVRYRLSLNAGDGLWQQRPPVTGGG
ncbi:MAG: hypothetical protein AAFN92_08300, partial [Bacteroidota bacterium]